MGQTTQYVPLERADPWKLTGKKQGDEVLHLPTIVEAAESTPAAARECAYQIRKCLSQANAPRPYVQYNRSEERRVGKECPV